MIAKHEFAVTFLTVKGKLSIVSLYLWKDKYSEKYPVGGTRHFNVKNNAKRKQI